MTNETGNVKVGIDVSAKTLDVAIEVGAKQTIKSIKNTKQGHERLIRLLTSKGKSVQVVLEATGTYSLGPALALSDHPRIQVMVANPRKMKSFSDASASRGKSDVIDARCALEFCKRMEFIPWERPTESALSLRSIMRRVSTLKEVVAAEKNRLHAKEYEGSVGAYIAHDIEANIGQLEERINNLVKAADKIVSDDEELTRKCNLLISVKGIALYSALLILAELEVLARNMTAPQWVAHAGLDPSLFQSGTSIKGSGRITKAGNKYLRSALYMPALSAVQYEPNVTAFYHRLIKDRKKPPMVGIVAVMRKLLHAIWGMLRHGKPFDGDKFYSIPETKS